jgi:predicted DNA-binding transcriptional regulator YafY
MSPERLSRLHRLAHKLAQGPVDKGTLMTSLDVGTRTLYRDLETLRQFGMDSIRSQGGFTLCVHVSEIEELLPFPDPQLNFADARRLASIEDPVARRIVEQFVRIVPDFESVGGI